MKKISFVVLAIILLFAFSACHKTSPAGELRPIDQIENWAYQLQNTDPQQIANSGFQLIVMDYSRDGTEDEKYSPADLQLLKDNGVIPICYISIGEVEDYRYYWQSDWSSNPPQWLGTENPEWKGNYAVRYWYPQWKQIIFDYLDKIIDQGFMGIYLDKVDEFEYWADSTENYDGDVYPEDSTAIWMIVFIREIADYVRAKNPDFYIIPQNGERILEYDTSGTILSLISAWGVEDMFYNETQPWTDEEWNYILSDRIPNLKKVLDAGHPVLSVDYVDNGLYIGDNKQRILDYYSKCQDYGYIPYAAKSDRALDKLNIINGLQP